MAPAWQAKLEASSKAVVEKEEQASRQAKLQQTLKENLNILFFDKVAPPSRLHGLITSLTIQFWNRMMNRAVNWPSKVARICRTSRG
jgi:hypothetical protein